MLWSELPLDIVSFVLHYVGYDVSDRGEIINELGELLTLDQIKEDMDTWKWMLQ